jgi:hypothetical protein
MGSYLQTMSARTVPSGSIAEVYCKAKGNVTFVSVFAGNLGEVVPTVGLVYGFD